MPNSPELLESRDGQPTLKRIRSMEKAEWIGKRDPVPTLGQSVMPAVSRVTRAARAGNEGRGMRHRGGGDESSFYFNPSPAPVVSRSARTPASAIADVSADGSQSDVGVEAVGSAGKRLFSADAPQGHGLPPPCATLERTLAPRTRPGPHSLPHCAPVTPSMHSRSKSAWPLCRAYSSIIWT